MDNWSRARDRDAYSSGYLGHGGEHVAYSLVAEQQKERRCWNRCNADHSLYFVPYKSFVGMMNYRT
jgi:hypothetical protein